MDMIRSISDSTFKITIEDLLSNNFVLSKSHYIMQYKVNNGLNDLYYIGFKEGLGIVLNSNTLGIEQAGMFKG